MEQLNNLDVLFLIVIGISALVGIARGMTKEILSIFGWVLAGVATFYLTPLLNPVMKQHISSEILATVVSGMVVLIGFCIVWILIVDKIAAVIRQSKLSTLDRLFGFIFGAARGCLIVVLVALMVSTLLPESSKEGVFAQSQIYKEASLYVEPLKAMVPQEWVDSVKAKTQSLGFGADQEKDADKTKAEKTDKKADVASGKNAEQKANSAEKQGKKSEKSSTLEDNLDALQKSGEELFNQLAQPKPEGETNSETASDESDLDKLLDVLEDKIVSSSASEEVLTTVSDRASKAVVDSIQETVADKVVTKDTKGVVAK